MQRKMRIPINYNLKPNKDGNYRPSFKYEEDGKFYSARDKDLVQAYVKLNQKYDELERGEHLTPKSKTLTVGTWADEFLAVYLKPTFKNPETNQHLKTYEGLIRNYIKPGLGSLPMHKVTEVQLQRFLNSAAAGEYSATGEPVGYWHMSKLLNLTRKMFHKAARVKIISFDPAEELTLPEAEKDSYRSITMDERKSIYEFSHFHPAGAWVLLMLRCGPRPSEICALQIKDIDLENKILHIYQTLESKSRSHFKAPKSNAGVRNVPIPDDIIPMLERHLHNKSPFDYFVTQQTTGKHHTYQSLHGQWNNFLREMDIYRGAEVYRNQIITSTLAPDLVPYCLRHTFCTDLQDAGIALNVAKYLMGHSSISVTADTYTDTTEVALLDVACKSSQYYLKLAKEANLFGFTA